MEKSIYDEETFFDAYSQMQRSVEGQILKVKQS